jgi:acyl-CoA thioesterase I
MPRPPFSDRSAVSHTVGGVVQSSRWVGALLATGGVVAAGAMAASGWRRFRARLTANSLVLNETLPVHSKWWRDHAKLEGELLYVAIGDSAAQGIGASSPDRSYVGVLADEIRAVTGRTVRVVNLSVSGATVELAVQDQLPRFVKLRPDIVTVAIGANDIARWDPAAFERGIRTIFEALPPHALVANLPFFYFPHNERKVAVANRIVRRVAAEHGLTVVPLHTATRHQGVPGMLTQFAIDMFHPNDHGYRVWADAFAPSLAAQLVARFPTPGGVRH